MTTPDVWGSVADWCMVLVTSVTAYYLYKTLKSQNAALVTQTKLFEIESVRFKESIKPRLKYRLVENEMRSENEEHTFFCIEVLNEVENNALDIKVDFPESGQAKRIFFRMLPHHIIKGENPYFVDFMFETKQSIGMVAFAVSYNDISGTRYKQGVVCIINNEYHEVNAYLPEIVDVQS